MGKAYLFYNPLAGQGKILEDLEVLSFVLDDETVLCDMTKPETFEEALFAMEKEDYLVLCGGDGTLNRFVNILAGIHRPNEIYYYPAGESNNFARDYGRVCGNNPFPITGAITDLPRLQMRDREGYFLTGVVFSVPAGFRGLSRKKREYTDENRPTGVRVAVDRALRHYDRVCFLAVMQGRHCHDGVIPDIQRKRTDTQLSCVLIHDCGKRKANRLIRQLQKGRRPDSRYLTCLRGADIRIAFEEPVTVYTDGEQQREVREFSAGRKETAR